MNKTSRRKEKFESISFSAWLINEKRWNLFSDRNGKKFCTDKRKLNKRTESDKTKKLNLNKNEFSKLVVSNSFKVLSLLHSWNLIFQHQRKVWGKTVLRTYLFKEIVSQPEFFLFWKKEDGSCLPSSHTPFLHPSYAFGLDEYIGICVHFFWQLFTRQISIRLYPAWNCVKNLFLHTRISNRHKKYANCYKKRKSQYNNEVSIREFNVFWLWGKWNLCVWLKRATGRMYGKNGINE